MTNDPSRSESSPPRAPESPDLVGPPPAHHVALELRLLGELPRFLLATRRLPASWPRGQGQPVLVIPGYGLDDRPTQPLRQALTRLGYAAHGWGLGRNLGIRRALMAGMGERLAALGAEHAQPVTLVGWSLGGVYARETARRHPELVRQVVTLGSPFSGEPDANTFDVVFKLLRPRRPVVIDRTAYDARRPAPPVPCLALHTKTDGVVNWRCSLEAPAPNTENIEVRGSHAGLVYNLEVLKLLAERLAT